MTDSSRIPMAARVEMRLAPPSSTTRCSSPTRMELCARPKGLRSPRRESRAARAASVSVTRGSSSFGSERGSGASAVAFKAIKTERVPPSFAAIARASWLHVLLAGRVKKVESASKAARCICECATCDRFFCGGIRTAPSSAPMTSFFWAERLASAGTSAFSFIRSRVTVEHQRDASATSATAIER